MYIICWNWYELLIINYNQNEKYYDKIWVFKSRLEAKSQYKSGPILSYPLDFRFMNLLDHTKKKI